MEVCLSHRMEIRLDTDINAYSFAQKLSKNLKRWGMVSHSNRMQIYAKESYQKVDSIQFQCQYQNVPQVILGSLCGKLGGFWNASCLFPFSALSFIPFLYYLQFISYLYRLNTFLISLCFIPFYWLGILWHLHVWSRILKSIIRWNPLLRIETKNCGESKSRNCLSETWLW